MRIVICTHQLPSDEPGGVGAFSVALASELAASAHQVTLLAGASTRSRAPAAGADVLRRSGDCWVEEVAPEAHGVRTLRLLRADGGARSALGRFLRSFTHRRVEELLTRTLGQLRPDVLHVQHTLNLSARLGSIGLACGAAVVATVHDYWPICQRIDLRQPDGTQCPGPAGGLRCAACLPHPGQLDHGAINLWDLGQRLMRRGERGVAVGARLAPYVLRTQLVQGGYALAQRVTCPAPAVAELLQRQGFDGRRLRLVDYGIPPQPSDVARGERPHRPFRLGFLGTMGPHKGLWVVLRAVELLLEQAPGPWELRIHGGPLRDPLLRERLHELAERSGNRVEYRGPYNYERLPGILTGLDAVVIPSVWRETGPMVWMEAMAAGLPVVASRIGALADRVRHEEDGLLVPPGDSGALAAALRRLMADYPGLRRGALARPVRTTAQAAAEMTAIYEEARGEAASGRR